MSDQSSANHIWQYKDLDTSTTSICFVDKKNILNVDFFTSKIRDIEIETKCLVNLHGLESQNGIVWIRIKNQCADLRHFAILLINSYTNNCCKEIVLPNMIKATCSANNKKKSSLTRSSTENSIASCATTSNPFGSILTPFTEETWGNINEKSKDMNLSNKEIRTCSLNENRNQKANGEIKKRYSLDFLLARSTVAESKKLPRNWKELNIMYPNICFVGTVLSYFNALKYYDHWIRIQNENPELHNPVETLTNVQYLNLSQDKPAANLDIRQKNYSSLIYNDLKTYPDQINNLKPKTKAYGFLTNQANKTDLRFFSAQNKNQKNSKKLSSN